MGKPDPERSELHQTGGRPQGVQAFAKFERLGLKAGADLRPGKLTPDIKAAVEAGIEDGRNAVIARLSQTTGINMNGWSLGTDLGYKDTDWLERARYGYIAVLGPIPSRSHTGAFGIKDSRPPPIGEHRYTIAFDLNDMPPVTEFWEIPLYDREGYFFDNPIDRYSFNSYMLKRGKLATADGKLVIYVQNDEPMMPISARTGCPRQRTVPVRSPLLRTIRTFDRWKLQYAGVVREE